jgi:hypothetical protein
LTNKSSTKTYLDEHLGDGLPDLSFGHVGGGVPDPQCVQEPPPLPVNDDILESIPVNLGKVGTLLLVRYFATSKILLCYL